MTNTHVLHSCNVLLAAVARKWNTSNDQYEYSMLLLEANINILYIILEVTHNINVVSKIGLELLSSAVVYS